MGKMITAILITLFITSIGICAENWNHVSTYPGGTKIFVDMNSIKTKDSIISFSVRVLYFEGGVGYRTMEVDCQRKSWRGIKQTTYFSEKIWEDYTLPKVWKPITCQDCAETWISNKFCQEKKRR